MSTSSSRTKMHERGARELRGSSSVGITSTKSSSTLIRAQSSKDEQMKKEVEKEDAKDKGENSFNTAILSSSILGTSPAMTTSGKKTLSTDKSLCLSCFLHFPPFFLLFLLSHTFL